MIIPVARIATHLAVLRIVPSFDAFAVEIPAMRVPAPLGA
jgi:hypothetical protein